MLNPFYTSQFKRDYTLQIKRHKNLERIDHVLRSLISGEPLPASNRDHPLQGQYKGYRECHIQPDWLLIYKTEGNNIYFVRTGTHSDLFK